VRVAPERLSTGQELVEHDAQAEDVRTAVDPVPLAPGLLRAHVRGSAGNPGLLAVVLIPQRQPEVGHARLALEIDQDVGRLDVAVDQAPGMGMVQRSATVATSSADWRTTTGPCPFGSAKSPLDVLGDDVAEAVLGAANAVDRDDARVVEASQGRGPRRYSSTSSGPETRSGLGTLMATVGRDHRPGRVDAPEASWLSRRTIR
jgi:hypothetical protein